MHYPAISFIAPFRIYVPDTFFDVKMSFGTSQVKAQPLPAVGVAGASQVHGPNVEIAHDIFGFAGRTKFYVVLDEVIDVQAPDWKAKVCDSDSIFFVRALESVNRLLAVYRDRDVDGAGQDSFHILELVRGDVSDIRLVVLDDGLMQHDDLVISWPGFHRMGFGQAVVRPDISIAQIARDLANATPIPVQRELLTSARNHLWRGPLRLVPVEANTAFEAFAFNALKAADAASQTSETAGFFEKLVALDRALQAAHCGRVPSWFDRAQSGWRGLDCDELLPWHRDCYVLRNKIVHEGYSAITTEEARNALEAASAAIAFVESCLDLMPEAPKND